MCPLFLFTLSIPATALTKLIRIVITSFNLTKIWFLRNMTFSKICLSCLSEFVWKVKIFLPCCPSKGQNLTNHFHWNVANKIRLGDWSYEWICSTSPNREISSYVVGQWASLDHNFTVYMLRTFSPFTTSSPKPKYFPSWSLVCGQRQNEIKSIGIRSLLIFSSSHDKEVWPAKYLVRFCQWTRP